MLIIVALAVDLDAFTGFFSQYSIPIGIATLELWIGWHLNIIESGHSLNHTHLKEIFDSLSQNAYGCVYIEEIWHQLLPTTVGTNIVIKQKLGLKQIQLGLNGTDGDMQIM
jgi:hypothetical protein